jgi:hypothetical protein
MNFKKYIAKKASKDKAKKKIKDFPKFKGNIPGLKSS